MDRVSRCRDALKDPVPLWGSGPLPAMGVGRSRLRRRRVPFELVPPGLVLQRASWPAGSADSVGCRGEKTSAPAAAALVVVVVVVVVVVGGLLLSYWPWCACRSLLDSHRASPQLQTNSETPGSHGEALPNLKIVTRGARPPTIEAVPPGQCTSNRKSVKYTTATSKSTPIFSGDQRMWPPVRMRK
jgi:hypothetical protein